MPKRLSKPSRDPNVAAFRMVQRIAEASEAEAPPSNVVQISNHRKNPAAVALGRKGGLQSAKARMEKIAPDERARIASVAARARWAKKGDG